MTSNMSKTWQPSDGQCVISKVDHSSIKADVDFLKVGGSQRLMLIVIDLLRANKHTCK